MTTLVVTAGHITALRLYDVAYAIDLGRAESAWTLEAGRSASRSRLAMTRPKAVAFGVPPLALPLDTARLALDRGVAEAGMTARLYEFGAIVLALRLTVANVAWDDFASLLNEVDRLVGPESGNALWTARLDTLMRTLGPALIRPAPSGLVEDYLLGEVQSFDRPVPAASFGTEIDLVPLLSGEHRPLSETARADLMRARFSYYTDDLVVLTWDRAFIYEPRGDSDVSDVLEVANAQLLEMRYYDELLDAELPRMYDLVEDLRRTLNLFAPRRYAHLARRLYALVAEVTELTEKIDNALQVTEDVYLARVYAAALDLFRVPSVGAAVDRKLAIIRDTYNALHDEASGSRGSLMEFLILLLILVEIVLALWRR